MLRHLVIWHYHDGSFQFLPPANVVCEGYVFTGVCDSVNRGGGPCVVFILGGHVWFYSGRGGVHGFIRGGPAWFYSGGACMVLSGGHAWFYPGGGVHGFSSFSGYNEIRSMSGRYASYWNAFLFMSAGFICLSPSRRSILKAFRKSDTPKSLFFDADQDDTGP